MLQVSFIPTLMQIRGTWLRSESVQTVVVKLLRKNRERCRGSLLLADINVKLSVGVEVFRAVITLKRGQTINGISLVAVLERFSERNSILHNRARQSDPGRDCGKAHD